VGSIQNELNDFL